MIAMIMSTIIDSACGSANLIRVSYSAVTTTAVAWPVVL